MRVSVLFSVVLAAGCISLGVFIWVLKERASVAETRLSVKKADRADIGAAVDAEKLRLAQVAAELAKLKRARVQAEEQNKINPKPLSYRDKIALRVAAPEAQARVASQLEPMIRIYGSIYGLIGQAGHLSLEKLQEVLLAAASRQAAQGVENTFRDILLNDLIRNGATESEAAGIALCGEYQQRLLAMGDALSADQLRDVAALVKGAAGAMVSQESGHGRIIGPFKPEDIQNLQKLVNPAQWRELTGMNRVLADRKVLADKWNEIDK